MLYAKISRITHMPRLGSAGVIADFYHDREATMPAFLNVPCRTYNELDLAGKTYRIFWL